MNTRIRLLYCEDNLQDADLMRTRFAGDAPDFSIEIVGTGQGCLDRLGDTEFDLLLLDHRLPDMDGLDVLKKLFHTGIRMPVVLVTGMGDEKLVVKALRLGASNYISKQGNYLDSLPSLLRGVVEDYRHKQKQGLPTFISPRRILYIENNPMDIDLTRRYFAEKAPEFVMDVVLSCDEALVRLEQAPAYDLVLVDLRMPNLNGLDFIREVKSRRLPLPPFIILTGKGDEDSAIAALKLGATDYITKHDDYLIELPHAIERAIDHDRLNSINEQMLGELEERKRAEEALRKSEERHREILQTAMDSFWLLDTQGHLLEVNQTYCQMSGYSEQELLTMSITDLEAAESAENTAAHMQNVLAQSHDRFETQHRRKDGSILDIEVSVQYHAVEGGRLVAFLRDITKHKQAETENQQLRDKAEISSRLAAVGEMAAGIAHEINNPLTGVIGFSELLVERQDLPEDVKEGLRIIADGGNRVKNIVKRMLTFARQTKPVRNSTNINELIENTLNLRAYVLRTANIEVYKHLDMDLPSVTVDPGQMQQVFLNLIVNAEYAMKKAHGKGTLVITTEKKDGHIRISFKDDGMGMSPEVKAKLFNPFFTTKPVGEGTGMGLGLSRSIVLEHGGTIEVESQPDQGATFIITLPLTLLAEEAVVQQPIADSNASLQIFRSARILVVDDEAAIRSLVSAIFTREGHTVDVTDDSREAHRKLEALSYDAVLMDIRMPGMSGMELYESIVMAHPEMKGRFIFVTGDISDMQVRDFLARNNLPFICKPFDRDTLERKVQSLLAGTQRGNTNSQGNV